MPDKKRRIEIGILTRYCKGCGLCVDVCPQDVLYLENNPNKYGIMLAAVREERDCSGCLKCVAVCPDAAIEVYRYEREPQKAASRQGAVDEG